MPLTALFYASLSVLFIGITPLFIKKIAVDTLPLALAFCLSLIGVFATGILILATRTSLQETGRFFSNPRLLLFLVIAGTLGALDYTTFGAALKNGAPISLLACFVRVGATLLTALIGVFLLGEKITPLQYGGIGLACLGLALILYKPV